MVFRWFASLAILLPEGNRAQHRRSRRLQDCETRSLTSLDFTLACGKIPSQREPFKSVRGSN